VVAPKEVKRDQSNPARILDALDRHLRAPFRLYLYGRAAIALGFPKAPEKMHATMDVDAILPTAEVGAIESNDDFWAAQEKLNRELGDVGLYFTHLFEDSQVLLTPDWQSKAVRIDALTFARLDLWRPSTPDLVLTKMMRVDPDDRSDIEFLMQQDDFSRAEMTLALANAALPAIPEIEEAFRNNREWLMGRLHRR
jgi:hypothetical protein